MEDVIFNTKENYDVKSRTVITGYLGISPLKKLTELEVDCKVVYGMYNDNGISEKLHDQFLKLQKEDNNLDIYYSDVAIHTKCYMWENENEIVHSLIGSANFTFSGLRIDYREMLTEVKSEDFQDLKNYKEIVLNKSIRCDEVKEINFNKEIKERKIPLQIQKKNKCTLVLYDTNTGEVQNSAGLNWGQHHEKTHTKPNDAYIPIKAENIRKCGLLFPPKRKKNKKILVNRGRSQRENRPIEIIWDDGTIMEGLLEGSQPVDGITYPKQISSFPKKNILGKYFRKRLGIEDGKKVTIDDLNNYGRKNVDVYLLEEDIYYFDFSV